MAAERVRSRRVRSWSVLLGIALGTSSCGSDTKVSPEPSPPRDCEGDWVTFFASEASAFAKGVARHPSGDLTVVGVFEDAELDLGGEPLAPASEGDTLFLARFDACGALRYSRALGAMGQLAFGGLPRPAGEDTYFVSGRAGLFGGDYELQLVKIDDRGEEVWAQAIEDAGTVEIHDLAVTYDGGVAMVGNHGSTLEIAGIEVLTETSGGGFVARFDADGNVTFAQSYAVELTGVAAPPNDDRVAMVGTADSVSIDVGGGELAPIGPRDLVVLALDTDGSHMWSKRFGGTGQVFDASVAANGLGEVLVAGSLLNGSLSLGGVPLEPASGGGFVGHLDGGNHVASIAAPQVNPGRIVAVGAGAVFFGETYAAAESPSIGDTVLDHGAFITTLTGDLTVEQTIAMGGAVPTGVISDVAGGLFTTGGVRSTTTLLEQTHTPDPQFDVFLMHTR